MPPGQLDAGYDWDRNLPPLPDQPHAAGEDDLGQPCHPFDRGTGKEPVANTISERKVKTHGPDDRVVSLLIAEDADEAAAASGDVHGMAPYTQIIHLNLLGMETVMVVTRH